MARRCGRTYLRAGVEGVHVDGAPATSRVTALYTAWVDRGHAIEKQLATERERGMHGDWQHRVEEEQRWIALGRRRDS